MSDLSGGSPVIKTLAAVLVASLLVGGGGCRQPSSAYHSFVLTRGIGHFSFEYPARYRVGKVEVKNEYTSISLHGLPVMKHRVPTFCDFFVNSYSGSSDQPDPVTELDKFIRDESALPDDFRLIDRSSISVSGIQGEQATYFENVPQGAAEGPVGTGPLPIITRMIYFAHGNSLWMLTFSYEQTTAASDSAYEADFEYILQTFKVLD